MKIAIVGSGISGITASCLLQGAHEVTVFEADERIGGHTHTVDVDGVDGRHAVDTGFIVYNEATYPNFIRLLERFKVPTQWSDMSFSVEHEASGRAYASHGFWSIFADRSALLSVAQWRLLREILRFNRDARVYLDSGGQTDTLDDFLRGRNFSAYFRERYLVPLFSAIWSAAPGDVGAYPANYFLNFFKNHGLLEVKTGPRWRVISGGSRTYAEAFTRGWRERVRLNTPVTGIERDEAGVTLRLKGGESERFDQVILAVHSDTALRMLRDPSDAERDVLSAMPYQDNEVVLHTDTRLMPRNRRAWASWNYYLPRTLGAHATLTYDMNRLQGLQSQERYLVTLNDTARIEPSKILRRFRYAHPMYTAAGIAAQRRHGEISGVRRTHYCGAYWGYGFHEDGVNSALRVAKAFGRDLSHA